MLLSHSLTHTLRHKGRGMVDTTGLWKSIKRDWAFITLGLIVVAVLAASAHGVSVNGWRYQDWSSFAELIVLSVGLVSLKLVHKQLIAQTEQARKDLGWKRINSFYEFFSAVPRDDINAKLHDLAVELSITEHFDHGTRAIDSSTADRIDSDATATNTVKMYLDCWEGFAGAVRCGLVDNDFAYSMECGRVVRTYTIFKPFIDRIQQINNPHAYLELEMLAKVWEDRRRTEKEQSRVSNSVAVNTLAH